MLYISDESWNFTPETSIVLYVNYRKFKLKKKSIPNLSGIKAELSVEKLQLFCQIPRGPLVCSVPPRYILLYIYIYLTLSAVVLPKTV